jgi:hypothetical protein
MRAYNEVPHWWYVIVYVSAFILAAAGLAKWLPEAPIWVLTFGFSTWMLRRIAPCLLRGFGGGVSDPFRGY